MSARTTFIVLLVSLALIGSGTALANEIMVSTSPIELGIEESEELVRLMEDMPNSLLFRISISGEKESHEPWYIELFVDEYKGNYEIERHPLVDLQMQESEFVMVYKHSEHDLAGKLIEPAEIIILTGSSFDVSKQFTVDHKAMNHFFNSEITRAMTHADENFNEEEQPVNLISHWVYIQGVPMFSGFRNQSDETILSFANSSNHPVSILKLTVEGDR